MFKIFVQMRLFLKEAKQTVEDPVKFSSHCPLVLDKKVNNTELQILIMFFLLLKKCHLSIVNMFSSL